LDLPPTLSYTKLAYSPIAIIEGKSEKLKLDAVLEPIVEDILRYYPGTVPHCIQMRLDMRLGCVLLAGH
jgi:hypothetical protein